ncbi:MAG: inositol monophosphatase family protein [Motilibacteraceae bacterium]
MQPKTVSAADDVLEALEVAAGLVADCGRYAVERQGGVVEEVKDDAVSLAGAVVTEVDREVESRLDDALAKAFPDDGMVGEEYVDRTGSSGRTWYADPVDGTLNYARRLGPWSVVLSAWREDACELVAVWTQGSVYTAAQGRGAQRDGRPLRLTSAPAERSGIVRVPPRLAAAAAARHWSVRGIESSATELCQVADGRVLGTVRLGGLRRDLHGPAMLVQEAGGVVTDLHGDGWDGASEGLVVAAPSTHAALLDLLGAGHR